MGRNLKYGEETSILTFRVPKSMQEDIRKYIKPYIWKKVNQLQDIKEGIKLEKEIKKELKTFQDRFEYEWNVDKNLDNKTKRIIKLMQDMTFKFKMFEAYKFKKLKSDKNSKEKVISIVDNINQFLNAQIREYLDYDSPKADSFAKPRVYTRIDKEGVIFGLEEIQYKIKKQLNYWYVSDLPDRHGFFQALIKFKEIFKTFLEIEKKVLPHNINFI